MPDETALQHQPRPTALAKTNRTGLFARGRAEAPTISWEAHYALGVQHYTGRGAEQDFAAAALCFRKAAELGHAESQYRLALQYEEGEGPARRRGSGGPTGTARPPTRATPMHRLR